MSKVNQEIKLNRFELNKSPPVDGTKKVVNKRQNANFHKFWPSLKFMELAVAGYCDIVLTEDQIL